MPTPNQQKKYPPAWVLLGEAAGEGVNGMEMVADSFLNRSRQRKLPMEEIVMQPNQYTAASRPDLEAFAKRQPIMLQNLAEELIKERQSKTFQPTYPNTEYVTEELWNRVDDLPKTHWLRKMEAVGKVGHHMILRERR